jgi:hypothetical protein
MNDHTVWVHPASYTFRSDQPERLIETLWVQRSGWGYLKRRDMWIRTDQSIEELEARGYQAWIPPHQANETFRCPSCGMYISNVPGYLAKKHVAACSGSDENWQATEDKMIAGIREEIYQRRLIEQKRRELEEQAEMERQERFDRIREEQQTRQSAKDRKKRLKEETREQLRKR